MNSADSSDANREIDMMWGVRIPLRDGVHLNATVFRPRNPVERPPVIVTLTPYAGDVYVPLANYFAQNAYAFTIVDARGRGSSEGQFRPNIQEVQDAYDVVEWLGRQSWCNGQVAMWGGSYAGNNQWAALKGLPSHLKSVVPRAAAFLGYDLPMQNNIMRCYLIQWCSLVSGKTSNMNLFNACAFWLQKFREIYLNHRPYKDLEEVAGNTTTHFADWVAHPALGPYWDAMSPTDEEYARIDLPILTITGHYDSQGAMEHYRRHMRNASPGARAKHYLIMGPWNHFGTLSQSRDCEGLTFGEASVLDINKLHREWYDWTLRGGAKPAFLKKRVAYYVTGAEEWRYADSLEAISNSTRTFYLDSDGSANDVFRSGALSENKPTQASFDQYVYDPLDVRPAELEKDPVPLENNWLNHSLVDQRYALNLFGAGLVYHSAPFAEDVDVAGNLRMVAWIEMDVPDTDFHISVYEIKLDGSSILLTEGRLRARYRESLREEKLITPGSVNRYEFTGFNFFSRRVARGSRLRLVLKAPNSIYYQKNYNSGGVVAEESGKDARTAHVRLYHDAERPSFLELPIDSTPH